MIVVFIGPPGVGKGTQASRLARALDVPHVASGDLLRAARAQDTPLGHQAKVYMDRGVLAPDELVVKIVEQRLTQPDATRGAVLDGFPRTLQQAHRLDELLARDGKHGVDVAIVLEAARDVVLERMRARRRDDETPEVQVKRYDVYEHDTRPLLAYYKERDILVAVDGDQPIDTVTSAIAAAVKRYAGNTADSTTASIVQVHE